MFKSNVSKVILLTFFARLHFYIHIGALYFLSKGLSLLEINAIDAIVILTIFLAEVPTGIIADRVGRKWSVVIGLLLRALGELLILFGQSFPAFAMMGVLLGIGFAFESGAWESLIYDTLPEEDREQSMKRAMGNIGSVANLGFFLSPLLGSLIVADLLQSQFAIAIVLTAGSLLLAGLIALTLWEPERWQRETKPDSLTILSTGWRELTGSYLLQRLVLVVIFTASLGGLLITLSQPHFVAQQAPVWMMGLALSLGSLIAIFSQKYAYAIEIVLGKRWGLVISAIVPGLCYLLLAIVAGALPVFLLVILIHGIGPIKSPLLSAYQNALIRSDSRATVLSLINMLSSLWIALGALFFGALADTSLPLAFLAIGGVIVIATVSLRLDRIPAMVDQQTRLE